MSTSIRAVGVASVAVPRVTPGRPAAMHGEEQHLGRPLVETTGAWAATSTSSATGGEGRPRALRWLPEGGAMPGRPWKGRVSNSQAEVERTGDRRWEGGDRMRSWSGGGDQGGRLE